jgi:hypothetical protein
VALELPAKVTVVVVAPPTVCKQEEAAAALEVQVVACHLQATPVTDSQAVAVLVRHQTSQVLPICTQAVAAELLMFQDQAVVAAWVVQVVVQVLVTGRVLLRVLPTQAAAAAAVKMATVRTADQVWSLHVIWVALPA